MNQPRIKYDEISDTLTISFITGVMATGIELTDNILLRINQAERQAVSLVLFDYSILTQKTDLGIRSFPLTGIEHLSEDLRELVLEMLLTKPVCEFLALSAYAISPRETIPIVSVKLLPVAV